MGRIRIQGIAGEMQGKIGDNVLALTKYGSQVKKLPSKHIVIPPGQMQEMYFMEFVSNTYDMLTEQEAAWWRQWASYPEIRSLYTKKRHLDGRNLFFAVNMKLIEIGEPLILSIPHFNYAQYFEKISIKIVKNKKGKKEIILDLGAAIESNTKIIITATAGQKDNLLFIHPVEYKKIAILDAEFNNGGSITRYYLKVFKSIPEDGLKISFYVSSVNRECGASTMPQKINVHQYLDGQTDGLGYKKKYVEIPVMKKSDITHRKAQNKRRVNAK